MRREVSGDGVRERAHGLLASLGVLEHGELGTQELVRLADWDAEREPVARGGDGLRGDVVLLEPSIDSLNGLGLGCKERLGLGTILSDAV